MKSLIISWCCLLAGLLPAATSDMLHARGLTYSADYTEGNVVFDGQRFVSPLVRTGFISLIYFGTNVVVQSNSAALVAGSTPSLACDGSNLVLAWRDANMALFCARVTNGALAGIFNVATNVATNTVSIRSSGGKLLALWQNNGSNSAVFARWLDGSGSPLAAGFAVAPGAQPQKYPSVNREGTNCLVAWMEQNAASNDWRVLARFVADSGPTGSVIPISQTNSMRVYQTACSFGTNFLVVWSEDEGPIPTYYYIAQPPYLVLTNSWYPMIHGRMFSADGAPRANEFTVARCASTNTWPAVAFDGSRHVVIWASDGRPHAQSLAPDGSLLGYPLAGYAVRATKPSIVTGAGIFCAVYSGLYTVEFIRDSMPETRLVNVRRAPGGGISADSSLPSWTAIEVSSNLTQWTSARLSDLPSLNSGPRLFVRAFDGKWQCIEQMRAIDWAKQQWAVDHFKSGTDYPVDNDLFGYGKYLPVKPACPHNGAYTLGSVQLNVTCNIAGHTF